MKNQLFLAIVLIIGLFGFILSPSSKPKLLFDGKTFKGWEGDTTTTWRIENGMLVGGSIVKKVPNNDFLCTTKSYDNFILKLKIKLMK